MNDRNTNRAGAHAEPSPTFTGRLVGLCGKEGCGAGAEISGAVCRTAATADNGHAVQGHLYNYNGHRVIAMRSGARVPVEHVSPITEFANAVDLVPLPMRYHGGELPR